MPHPFSSKSHAGVWLLFAIVLAGLDQAVKYVVQIFLPLRASIEITPFFNLVHVLNPGAAFSFLANAGGWQRYFFITLGLAVSAWLGRMLCQQRPRLEAMGYSLKDCIAFGDGMNDAEMLSMAGKGCIMGNAHQRLKDLHPELEVIGSNADNAVPKYLRKLFLE